MFLTGAEYYLQRSTKLNDLESGKSIAGEKTTLKLGALADVILGLGLIAVGILATQNIITMDPTLSYGLMGIGVGYIFTSIILCSGKISYLSDQTGDRQKERTRNTLIKIALLAFIISGIGFGVNSLQFGNTIADSALKASLGASLTSLTILGGCCALNSLKKRLMKNRGEDNDDLSDLSRSSSFSNEGSNAANGDLPRPNVQSTATTVKSSQAAIEETMKSNREAAARIDDEETDPDLALRLEDDLYKGAKKAQNLEADNTRELNDELG